MFPGYGKATVPVHEQEIIEDILFVMEGVTGRHIKEVPLSENYGRRDFIIDPSIGKLFL